MTPPTSPGSPTALRAYLTLRDEGITTIAEAIVRLRPPDGINGRGFDAIADGLHLYMVELEDEYLLPALDVDTVRQLCDLRESGASSPRPADAPVPEATVADPPDKRRMECARCGCHVLVSAAHRRPAGQCGNCHSYELRALETDPPERPSRLGPSVP